MTKATSTTPFADTQRITTDNFLPAIGEVYWWRVRWGRKFKAKVVSRVMDDANNPLWFSLKPLQTADENDVISKVPKSEQVPMIVPWHAVEYIMTVADWTALTKASNE